MLKYSHVCQPANVTSPAGAGLAENRKFSYQRDTRQISITNWKGPISNEPFNHSYPSPTTAAESVKKHHPSLAGVPRTLHASRFTLHASRACRRHAPEHASFACPPPQAPRPLHASRFTLHAPAPAGAGAHYICREPSTNQPFLCKTNPIS